jgi:cytochrome b
MATATATFMERLRATIRPRAKARAAARVAAALTVIAMIALVAAPSASAILGCGINPAYVFMFGR